MAEIFGDEIDVGEVLAQHGEKALVHSHRDVMEHSQDKVDYN